MAETIGSLVDKLSIVELKIFHMDLQTQRTDVDKAHIERCQQRVGILKTQKEDLVAELTALSEAVLSGKHVLKVYRQFKMYNDAQYKQKTPA